MLSSCPSESCSKPTWPPLKLNTATTCHAEFAGPADLPDRHSLAVTLTLALIRGYKIFVSPMFAGSCRFLPSCADYARDAVIKFGVLKGSWLAARRLARCHPLCAGGHDPVPQRWRL